MTNVHCSALRLLFVIMIFNDQNYHTLPLGNFFTRKLKKAHLRFKYSWSDEIYAQSGSVRVRDVTVYSSYWKKKIWYFYSLLKFCFSYNFEKKKLYFFFTLLHEWLDFIAYPLSIVEKKTIELAKKIKNSLIFF